MESLIKPIAVFLISLMLTLSLSGFNFSRTPATPAPNPSLNPTVSTAPLVPSPTTTSIVTLAFQQAQEAFDKGEYKAAIPQWETAIAFYKKSNDRLNQAATLNNLALTYHKLGQWQQAQATIQDSLKLITPPKPSSKTKTNPTQITIYAQALDIQANIHFNQGRTQEALNHWQTTEKIYTQLKDDEGQRYSQFNQAQALYTIGFFTQSQTILLKLAKTLKDTPSGIEKAKILLTLSQYYQSIGQLESKQSEQAGEYPIDAKSTIDQAFAIVENLPNTSDKLSIYLAKANIIRSIAEQERDIESAADYQVNPLYKAYTPENNSYTKAQEALAAYARALTLSNEMNNRSDLTPIQIQINMLSLQRELNKETEALKLLPQINDRLTKIEAAGTSPAGISRATIYTRIHLARALQFFALANQPNIAKVIDLEQLLRTAYQNAQSQGDVQAESYALGTLGRLYELQRNWTQAQAQTQQALQLARTINTPDITYLWQWQLGRILRDSKNRPKAIKYYQSAVETLKIVRNDLSGTASNRQFSFRDDAEPVYRELVDLLLTPQASDSITPEDLKNAVQVIDSLQVAELNNYLRCVAGKVVPIEEVTQKIDKQSADTAIVYTIILSNRLEIVIKLPGVDQFIHRTSLIEQSDLEDIINKALGYFRSSSAATNEVKENSKELYNKLFKPMESQVFDGSIKKLVFLLDGSLRSVPISALWDGKQYLIERYAISVTPSLSLLGPQRLQNKTLKTLFAGLTVNEPIANIPRTGKVPQNPLKKDVERELVAMKANLPSITELTGNKFTFTNLKQKLKNSDFQVLHLSTHGEFSSQNEKTYLVTASESGEIINLEQLRDLVQTGKQNRPNAIQLVVFSACRTASGDRRATLGMSGAAVRSGANSTLSTLWSVDPEPTAEFMAGFYQELQTANKIGISKTEVLQKAQMKILKKGGKSARPFFWSSFILIGDWL